METIMNDMRSCRYEPGHPFQGYLFQTPSSQVRDTFVDVIRFIKLNLIYYIVKEHLPRNLN